MAQEHVEVYYDIQKGGTYNRVTLEEGDSEVDPNRYIIVHVNPKTGGILPTKFNADQFRSAVGKEGANNDYLIGAATTIDEVTGAPTESAGNLNPPDSRTDSATGRKRSAMPSFIFIDPKTGATMNQQTAESSGLDTKNLISIYNPPTAQDIQRVIDSISQNTSVNRLRVLNTLGNLTDKNMDGEEAVAAGRAVEQARQGLVRNTTGTGAQSDLDRANASGGGITATGRQRVFNPAEAAAQGRARSNQRAAGETSDGLAAGAGSGTGPGGGGITGGNSAGGNVNGTPGADAGSSPLDTSSRMADRPGNYFFERGIPTDALEQFNPYTAEGQNRFLQGYLRHNGLDRSILGTTMKDDVGVAAMVSRILSGDLANESVTPQDTYAGMEDLLGSMRNKNKNGNFEYLNPNTILQSGLKQAGNLDMTDLGQADVLNQVIGAAVPYMDPFSAQMMMDRVGRAGTNWELDELSSTNPGQTSFLDVLNRMGIGGARR